jgi:hypothetical protein
VLETTLTTDQADRKRKMNPRVPLGIPLVPTFDYEKALDIAKEAATFLEHFAKAINQRCDVFLTNACGSPV